MLKSFFQITVEEILQRPHFKKASIVAGFKGLSRTVQWAHVIEVPTIGKLLNGNELILSTGLGWNQDEKRCVSFLQQLIDSNASCLCIELGTNIKELPAKMIQLANNHHFPIITFHKEVRFVDITQDLHSIFVNQQHQMVEDLENFSQELNQILLSGEGLSPLLKTLQTVSKSQVAYLPTEGDAEFYPPLPKEKKNRFLACWNEGELTQNMENQDMIAKRPIHVLNHFFADLVLYSCSQPLSQFEIFALDRCSTAVAQVLMRTLYMEEKRRNQEDAWIHAWLGGKMQDEQIRNYIRFINPVAKFKEITVCMFDTIDIVSDIKDSDRHFIQKTIIARSIFEQEGFFLIHTEIDYNVVYILLNQRDDKMTEKRILRAIKRLQDSESSDRIHLFTAPVAVGSFVIDLGDVHDSYSTAKETLMIQKKIGRLQSPFYYQLHIYRVVSVMDQSNQLQPFINEYLGSLLQYDKEKNAQLLHTLKTYLNYHGAKQETAKDLFIVRQTLYHRLDKITELLGDDFMLPQKRIAIEFAIYCYEYLNGAVVEKLNPDKKKV